MWMGYDGEGTRAASPGWSSTHIRWEKPSLAPMVVIASVSGSSSPPEARPPPPPPAGGVPGARVTSGPCDRPDLADRPAGVPPMTWMSGAPGALEWHTRPGAEEHGRRPGQPQGLTRGRVG